jgi:hypothetical protein
VIDIINAQQIDDLIREAQAKAEEYASQPERFTLLSLELEVRADYGNQLVIYNDGDWSCTCAFFEEWRTCRHVRATSLLLKDSFFPLPGEQSQCEQSMEGGK